MTPNRHSGYFLSFEGIDGAGKSTHLQALATHFLAQGRDVLVTREPGGTRLAEKIRSLVLHEAMDPLTESLLVFAARRSHVQEVIVPALSAGKVVLCDRFTDATFAYQGGGRGFNWSTLETLERWVQDDLAGGLIQPNLTVWFDLAPNLAAERLKKARAADRFEALDEHFFEQVVAGYQRRVAADPTRFLIVNADQTVADVWQELLAALKGRQVLA